MDSCSCGVCQCGKGDACTGSTPTCYYGDCISTGTTVTEKGAAGKWGYGGYG